MYGETKHDMQCAEFEQLLADALDGVLAGERLSAFQSHATVCPNCGPMLADAQAGLGWLKSLEEVEPPAHLVRSIMLATAGAETARAAAPKRNWVKQIRESITAGVTPVFAALRQPRFAMSFGMAFFSISLLLNAAGVKLTDVRHLDLRPTAMMTKLYEAKGRVVAYYENIRFVYELETKVRELRRATTPQESPAPQQQDKKDRKDNTTGEPDREKYQNYSRDDYQPVLAMVWPAANVEPWREL